MDSVQLRRYLLPPLIAATLLLAVYGLFSPQPQSVAGSLILVGLSVLLAAGVWAAEQYDPHLQNLVQEKSYRITLRSVLATALLTGFVFLIGLYAAAAVIGVVAVTWGYEPVSFQVFADVVSRLALLLDAQLLPLVGGYIAVAAAMGAGFWVLFPYLPVADERRAAPASFLAVWIYLVAAAAVFRPVPVSEPTVLAFDAAVVAVWGHVFAVAYRDVERYVP